MLETILKDLPHFPEQIIADWLLPRTAELGWPPKEDTHGPMLMYHSSDWWRGIVWEKKTIVFKELALSQSCRNVCGEIISRYKGGFDFVRESCVRINNILDFIKINNVLPKPVVLILKNGKFEIVDGNHRLAACQIVCDENFINIPVDASIGTPNSTNEDDTFYWDNFNDS